MKSEQIEIFRTPDCQAHVTVTFRQETVWLNQEQLSHLFGRDRKVIGRHIGNLFNEVELQEKLVCADFAQTTQPGAMNHSIKEQKHSWLWVQLISGSLKWK